MDSVIKGRLQNDYTYHAPKGNQPERYDVLRGAFLSLAELIVDLTPSSREQSCSLTELERACFYANAAIARGE
jgi:hypothetical protein